MDFDILYYVIDEYLKNRFPKEDKQISMNDSEVIFTYIIAFYSFSGNYFKTLFFLKHSNLMKEVISSSRFSRRLNRIENKIQEIAGLLYEICKRTIDKQYCIDSFPLPVCHLTRMKRCKLLTGPEYLGYNASKDEYFYGFKVHIMASRDKGVVEVSISAGSCHDGIAFKTFNFDLPESSEVFADKIYNDYLQEELLKDCAGIKFAPIRKSNSKKSDNTYCSNRYRQVQRKIIESIISHIENSFPKKIHATNIHGFILKILGFILCYNFSIVLS